MSLDRWAKVETRAEELYQDFVKRLGGGRARPGLFKDLHNNSKRKWRGKARTELGFD